MNAEVYPSPDGWRFRVTGNNHEIVAYGEAYMHRSSAEHALHLLFGSEPVNITLRDHLGAIISHYMLREPEPVIVETFGIEDTAQFVDVPLPYEEEGDDA